MADKREVETFVHEAQNTLAKRAASIEEIGTARQTAKGLMAALPQIVERRRRIEENNRLLRSMASSSNAVMGQQVDMTEVDNAWENFTTQLQQHDAQLEDQKQQLQGSLNRQVCVLWLIIADSYCCSFAMAQAQTWSESLHHHGLPW